MLYVLFYERLDGHLINYIVQFMKAPY
jgi:hypothetical protein